MSGGLKHIKDHIRAVSNIKKITTSMKMVSASKYLKAEKNLINARPLGLAAKHFYDLNPLTFDTKDISIFIFPVTSDRGLCGSMPVKICKYARIIFPDDRKKYRLVCLGEKARLHFLMDLKEQIYLVVNGLGHKIPTFLDASMMASYLLSETDFIYGKMVYGHYTNVMSFEVRELIFYSPPLVINARELHKYDTEDDVTKHIEFSIAVLFFYTICENYVVELSSRMNAMTSAAKNAGDLSKRLRLQYNRLRQASVTKELIDIVSGAQVVGSK